MTFVHDWTGYPVLVGSGERRWVLAPQADEKTQSVQEALVK